MCDLSLGVVDFTTVLISNELYKVNTRDQRILFCKLICRSYTGKDGYSKLSMNFGNGLVEIKRPRLWVGWEMGEGRCGKCKRYADKNTIMSTKH